jgi:homoserine kinase
MRESVIVFAPATIANLSCGFDILGLALDSPGDTVSARALSEDGKVEIASIVGDGSSLPRDPTLNTAGVAASGVLRLLERFNVKGGVSLDIIKGMPLGSGLGSSAASAVAAAYATNLLFGEKLTKEELLPAVIAAEGIASGEPHPDNVAPSLMGGIVLMAGNRCLNLPVPKDLVVLVVNPSVEVRTRDSRQVLRRMIPLSLCTAQCGALGLFINGLFRNDFRSLELGLKDYIVEPERAVLIPCFQELQDIAKSFKALGFGISGSGPSVFSLFNDPHRSAECGERQKRVLQNHGITARTYLGKVNEIGVHETFSKDLNVNTL